MEVTETLSEGLKREFKIVVPSADIEGRLTAKLVQLSKEVRMPGFRPGKVPVALLRKMHAKNVMGEILEKVVNDNTSKVMSDNDLRPALQPKIEIISFEEAADLEYTVAVEVMPNFEPMDFSTLKLEKTVADVTDETLDERLNDLAKQAKSFDEAGADHAAENGDQVVINFEGSVDGELFEGGTAEDFALELGSSQFIPGFEEQLVGVKSGAAVEVKLTFPDDYQAEALAGKDAVFKVTVLAVKIAKDETIDDEFAVKFGMENLAKLRDAMRIQVEQEYSGLTRQKLKRELLDALADGHDYEIPGGMVDQEFDSIWEKVVEDLEKADKSVADLDQGEEAARAEYRDIAQRRVRLGLLLSEVGRANNLVVSQEEVNRAIAQQSQNFPGQEQQIFQFYQQNQEAQAQIRAPILEDKVVDFILEIATVEESKVSIEELLRDPDEEEDVAAKSKPAKKKAAAKKATAKKEPAAKKKAAGKKTSAKKAAGKETSDDA